MIIAKNKYLENLTSAIEILTNKTVADASYDKTIKCIIINCVDEDLGKYKVKFQDGTFYAYSTDTSKKYSNNTMVYVLIPGNDMNTTKTILGTVEKLGDDYINLDTNIDRYEVLSGNLTPPVDREKEYGLCSYSYALVNGEPYTYAEISIDTINPIEDSYEALQKIITELGATHIKVCGYFKSNLSEEQKNKGDYGLRLKDMREDIEEIYFSINQMEGNPYNFSTYSYQEFYFPIPNGYEKGKLPPSLYFYKEGFLTSDDTSMPNDLFVKDCSVYLVKKIEGELLSSSLSLKVADGKSRFFSSPVGTIPIETRKLIPELKIKGATIKTGMEYYWFIEDSSIGPATIRYQEGQKTLQGYSPFGGVGWRCLNDIKVNNQEEQYATNQTTYTVTQDDILTNYVKYKCVVIYKGQSYSKEIILGRTDNIKYTIDFSIDGGNPIKVDGKTVGMNIGTSTKGSTYKLSCSLSTEESEQLGVLSYNWIFSPSGDDTLTDIFPTDLNNPNTIKIDTNKITGNKAFYKVTIFNTKDNITECAGTATFTLYMTDEKEQSYLNIINGDQVFQYDEYGVSPANENLHLNPQIIKELDFTLVVDQTTINFDETLMSKDSVVWVIPKENTLIDITGIPEDDVEDETSEAGKILVYNHKTLPFKIKNNYNYNYYNNQIELRVTHNGQLYTTRTNFTFLKQGEIGTNGTDITCKIILNTPPSNRPTFPIVTIYNYKSGTPINQKNWGYENNKIWFISQLWRNGEKIFESSSSTSNYTVTWDVLTHVYDSGVEEKSFLNYDRDQGAWSILSEHIVNYISSTTQPPVNIVKCTIKDIKTNKEYVATLPIPFICYPDDMQNSSFSVNLDTYDLQQVLYSSSGNNPSYNTQNAIKITVNGMPDDLVTNNIYIDIRCSTAVWDEDNNEWVWIQLKANSENVSENKSLLFIKSDDKKTFKPNKKDFIVPTIAARDSFKGVPNNNAISIYINGKDTQGISRAVYIHIPVHLYLNHYGLSSINGWDGNSIKIDEDGGYILAPQMGAGIKDANNKFTGVVMGVAKEANQTKEQIGLFGFSQGLRSFFLDAETGRAEFGTTESGQIVIDPSADNALTITSNGYKENSDGTGSGLKIDFKAPSIKFGNGNFSVDSNGFVTMRKAEIGDINSIIITNKIADYSIHTKDHPTFDSDREGFYLGSQGFSMGENLNINMNGEIDCQSFQCLSGFIGPRGVNSSMRLADGAIHSQGKETAGTNAPGYYLGKRGSGYVFVMGGLANNISEPNGYYDYHFVIDERGRVFMNEAHFTNSIIVHRGSTEHYGASLGSSDNRVLLKTEDGVEYRLILRNGVLCMD